MKTLIFTSVILSCLGTAVFSQKAQVETRDGMRHAVPKERNTQNDDGNKMQDRAIELGLFSWAAPSGEPIDRIDDGPKKVSDCSGHDPSYRPAHSFEASEEPRVRKIGQGKAFVYEIAAYGNALRDSDCTCTSLKADWPLAEQQFEEIVIGIEKVGLLTIVPSRVHAIIQNDFNRMCDVSMSLELE